VTGDRGGDAGPAGGLRLGLAGIAGLGSAGTALELALARHWGDLYQWMPWPAVVLMLAATAVMLRSPGPRAVRWVRTACVLVCAVAALGVLRHVVSNYQTAPLDAVYGLKWESMSQPARWWAAASGAVGPSPALAPGALAMTALCLLLATWRYPARLSA
jgi:hypothetical protein